SSKVVRAYGYDDNALDAHSVWGWDYDGAGTSLPGLLVSGAGEHPYAGDQAGLVWWKVDRKTSKGKYIYLRKFFHDGFLGAGKDVIGSTTNAAYDAFATTLATTGTGVGGRWIRSRIQDEVVLNHDGSAWVTTRTLKKRGKRPLKPAAPGLA
ncbi:MAG TPA: hypothetical protein VF077_13490, partial [Nitrospiraceae bacterium]